MAVSIISDESRKYTMTAFKRAQRLQKTLSKPFVLQTDALEGQYALLADIGPTLLALPFALLLMGLFYVYGMQPYHLASFWMIPFSVLIAIPLIGLSLWLFSKMAQRLQGAIFSKSITTFAFDLPEDLILDKEGQTLGPSISSHSKLLLMDMLATQGFQALVVKHQRVYYL